MDNNFWRNYQEVLLTRGIYHKSIEWYLRWAQAFEKALMDLPLSKCTKEDVNAYFDSLVRQNRFQDWQLNQANDALRILLGDFLSLSWAQPWPLFFGSFNDASSKWARNMGQASIKFKDVPNLIEMEKRFSYILDKIKRGLRARHYAYSTEQSYVEWICRFISFHDMKNPEGLGPVEVKAYLEYLAVQREVASSTQRQALNAIVFLYNKILNNPLGDIGPYQRPKKTKTASRCFNQEGKR